MRDTVHSLVSFGFLVGGGVSETGVSKIKGAGGGGGEIRTLFDNVSVLCPARSLGHVGMPSIQNPEEQGQGTG